MKRAAVLLLQMQQVCPTLFRGRNEMTPDEAQGLWARYQNAEAELHWIIPPAVKPLGAAVVPSYSRDRQR